MKKFPSTKSKRLLKAIEKKGWAIKSQSGSHIRLVSPDGRKYTFAFHQGEEIGGKMLKRIAKEIGLEPEDL